MNTLQTNIKTMTSRELLNVINASRQLSGEPVTRLNKLNEKIVDELEGEHYTKRVVQNLNNTTSDIFELTIEQCTLIGMRESKSVRRSVLDKLKAMDNTPAIPQTYAAALLEAGRLAGIVEDQQAQLEIAAPKITVYEALADRKTDVNTTKLAKQLGLRSAQQLNKFLRENNIKMLMHDLPKAGYSDWFNCVALVNNGHESTQCLITPLGQIEIAKLYEAKS